MTTPLPTRALPVVPAAAFVLVWCSGYIAGPAAVEALEPFTSLTVRFVLAALVTAVLARRLRGPMRLRGAVLGRVAVVGLAMNGAVFALMYLAFDAGMGATLASLLHALSPVLTALLAGVVLHERLTRVQVAGFVLGVVGVVLVLGPDVDEAGGPVGVVLGLLSLLALSLGTLGQRWYGAGVRDVDTAPPDPWWAATVQFAVCVPPLGLLAVLLEGVHSVPDVRLGVVSVLWLALVNSVAGLLLLGSLVRSGGAGASASLFFVCPPVTAVLAFLFFGDTLGVREVAGILVATVGVAVATGVGRRSRADVENVPSAPSQG
ncbi:DMT family transporter [Phycicoccus sp. BSK3Z-2]|uniref:DMT family transporter n=1 Tax=Phycicoccus avicenniae TaxID=2828860 RepID=A0A941D9U7_9MICO|nr:DMT family transporter [Phycicoccus avicenniae]MBR7744196.1 DMT family transporter [Phycicoccus avicenniae]